MRIDIAAHARPVDEDQVDEIIAMGKRLHPRHEQFDELGTIFHRWHRLNSDVFQFVFDPETRGSGLAPRAIGYTCMIPLSEQTFLDYEAGRLSEWKIGQRAADIVSDSSARRCRHILIQSIELDDYCRSQFKFDQAMLHAIFRHLSLFNADPDNVKPILIADGNEVGARILSRRGFERIAEAEDAADARPLFKLNFAQTNPTAKRADTLRELGAFMKSYGHRPSLGELILGFRNATSGGAFSSATVSEPPAPKSVRAWFDQWEWALKALAAVCGLAAAVIAIGAALLKVIG